MKKADGSELVVRGRSGASALRDYAVAEAELAELEVFPGELLVERPFGRVD
jgi:hypothetical protein